MPQYSRILVCVGWLALGMMDQDRSLVEGGVSTTAEACLQAIAEGSALRLSANPQLHWSCLELASHHER